MASVYGDPFLKDIPDFFFDDYDFKTLPDDLGPDLNLEQLISDCNDPIEGNEKILEGASSNSTLESLLKTIHRSGFVPPAPQVPVDSNRVIEAHRKDVKVFKLAQNEEHPQLKQALVQDTVSFKSNTDSFDTPDGLINGVQGYLPSPNLVTALHPTGTSHNSKFKEVSHLISERGYFFGSNDENYPQENGMIKCSKSARKSPHNAIERRYRQSINGKIDELRDILNASSGDDLKTNKSAVLRRAIDRIRYLEKENECFRMELKMYRSGYKRSDAICTECSRSLEMQNGSAYGPVGSSQPHIIYPSTTNNNYTSQMSSHVNMCGIHSHCTRHNSVSNSSAALQETDYVNHSHNHVKADYGNGFMMKPNSGSELLNSPQSEMSLSVCSGRGGPSTTSSSSFSPESLGNGSVNSLDCCCSAGKRPADGPLLLDQGPIPAKAGLYLYPVKEDHSPDQHYLSPGYPQQQTSPLQMMTVCLANEEMRDCTAPPDLISDSAYHSGSSNSISTNSTTPSTQDHQQSTGLVYTSSVVANRSPVTRASLFLGSFCLFIFNPFVLNSGSGDEGATAEGMPVRQLLSALSLNTQRPGNESSMISPLLLSLMYVAQWIVALLLLWVARPFNGSIFRRRSQHRCRGPVINLSGGSPALNHYRQAEEDQSHAKMTNAGVQLKAALASIGESPCLPRDNGSRFNFIPRALFWTQVYVHGLKLLCVKLPYFVYILYRRSRQRRVVKNERRKSAATQPLTVLRLRRQLLDLRFLDLMQLSNNAPVPSDGVEMSSYELLHVLRLMFACLEDWVSNWSDVCQGCRSTTVDIAEMIRLGVVLSLSVKRFFGLHWVGNLVLRGTQHLSELTSDSEASWLGPLDGPIMNLLLASQPDEHPHPEHRKEHLNSNKQATLRIFLSPLSIRRRQAGVCAGCTTESLVVDEVHSELSETLMAKAQELIIAQKLGSNSLFDVYIKALRRLSGLSWIKIYLSRQSPMFNLGSEYTTSEDETSEISTYFDENEETCYPSSHMEWWLDLLELCGKWYSTNPPLAVNCKEKRVSNRDAKQPIGALKEAPFTLLHGSNKDIVCLMSVAYNALAVTQSNEFSGKTQTSQRDQENMLLALWIAVRQSCDLLDCTASSFSALSCNTTKDSGSAVIDLKAYVFATFQLMAQDWLCQVIAAVSQKWQVLQTSENNITVGKDPKTHDCLRHSLDTVTIASTFSNVLKHQKEIAQLLNAYSFIWIAHLVAIERRLCGSNPLRTRLFLLQSMNDANQGACTQVAQSDFSSASVAFFGICCFPVNTALLLRRRKYRKTDLSLRHNSASSPRFIHKPEFIRRPPAAPSSHCSPN